MVQSSPLFIAFANNHDEPMLLNLKKSLEKFGYDYMIVGKDVPWKSFMTKIEHLLKYIETLPEDKIIVCADAYDVLATGPPDELMSKFRGYNSSLVCGAETFCGNSCVPVDKWWKYHRKIPDKIQYANGGFYMGTVCEVSKLFRYELQLGNPDDQEALCTYINTNSDLISKATSSG